MPVPPGYEEVTSAAILAKLENVDDDYAWLPEDVGDPECDTIIMYSRYVFIWYIPTPPIRYIRA